MISDKEIYRIKVINAIHSLNEAIYYLNTEDLIQIFKVEPHFEITLRRYSSLAELAFIEIKKERMRNDPR